MLQDTCSRHKRHSSHSNPVIPITVSDNIDDWAVIKNELSTDLSSTQAHDSSPPLSCLAAEDSAFKHNNDGNFLAGI